MIIKKIRRQINTFTACATYGLKNKQKLFFLLARKQIKICSFSHFQMSEAFQNNCEVWEENTQVCVMSTPVRNGK